MTDAAYPHGDSLVPDRFYEHTILFLLRASEPPALTEQELDVLQVEHLTNLRDLSRRGVLIANGPLAEQTDDRMRGVSVYALPLEQAMDLARADPMVRAGWLQIHGARWSTAEGSARFGATG